MIECIEGAVYVYFLNTFVKGDELEVFVVWFSKTGACQLFYTDQAA